MRFNSPNRILALKCLHGSKIGGCKYHSGFVVTEVIVSRRADQQSGVKFHDATFLASNRR